MKKLLLIALTALTLPATNLVAGFITISDAIDLVQERIVDQTNRNKVLDSIIAVDNGFGMIDRNTVMAIIDSMTDQQNDYVHRMQNEEEENAKRLADQFANVISFNSGNQYDGASEQLARQLQEEENAKKLVDQFTNVISFNYDNQYDGASEQLARQLQEEEKTVYHAQNEQVGMKLALQLHQKEQLISDAALARLLQETSNQAHELQTNEAEGHFSYVQYKHNPANPAHVNNVQSLQATHQQGNTCGIHTVVNAQAINQCLALGQPITNLRNFHGGIYNNAINGIKNTQNLLTQEVLELSQKLGINNFYALVTIKKDEYLLVQKHPTQQLSNALEALKKQPHGAIHFGLHVGNHWALLSIIKEHGNTYLSYADSANVSSVNAQHYIRFVNDTFMK